MSVASHVAGKDPTVRATNQRLVNVARTLGPVKEEAKPRTSSRDLDRDADNP